MNEKETKQLAKAIGDAVKPFLIGLRHEIKETNNRLDTLVNADPVSIENINLPEQREVVFPETQKVHIENPTTEVTVKGYTNEVFVKGFERLPPAIEKGLTSGFGFISKYLENSYEKTSSLIKGALAQTFKVQITNHKEFPTKLNVTVDNPQAEVFISNRLPKDAVPVVLTTADRKKFYNAMQAVEQRMSAFDINLDGVKTALLQVATNLSLGQGKTLLFGTIAQGSAGTTVLVSAQTGKKIKVVSYAFTLSLDGTAKFKGTADLTGAMDIVASGGAVTIGQPSSHLFETETGVALSIVTTLGLAKGHFSYFVE